MTTLLRFSNQSQIVFVMDNLVDWQSLVAVLPPTTDVILLDHTGDGLRQMTDFLAGLAPGSLSSVQLLSHGSAAHVNFGVFNLSPENLASRAEDLRHIGQALDAEGDWLIYGCDVAKGEQGAQFIRALAGASGADVAASTDLTGYQGNWSLEASTGPIAQPPAWTQAAAVAYGGVLIGAAPTITSGATATVVENASVDTVIYTIEAADPENDTLTYSLSGAHAASFTVDSSTGVVKLRAAANYEAMSSYNITVVAHDGESWTTKAVTVSVVDVDEAPVISSYALSNFSEMADASTVIYTAAATDPEHAAVTYSLSGADAAAMSIDGSTGYVRMLAPADYESKSSYSVTLVATDPAGNAATMALTLNVRNVNEKPSITAPASQKVNQGSATALTGISVSDPDSGSNPITVSLSVPAGRFSAITGAGVTALGSGTSYITLTGTQANVNAFIAAGNVTYTSAAGATGGVTLSIGSNDGGSTGTGGTQTDSRTETLNINAIPVITSGATASISENSLTGTHVYTVTASDSASDTLTFSLGGTDAAAFDIDAGTGQVTVRAVPNYEAQSTYSITVLASDGAATVSQAVTINVVNINEAPSDIQLSSSSVAENTSTDPNLPVGVLTSTDPDNGGSFMYAIVGGADASRFEISGNVLRFTAGTTLDHEAKSAYSVTVRTTDQGGLYYDKTFTINVTNVNEAPAFTSGATGTVNENAAAGSVVYTAAATDPESDAITYSLSGADAGAFAINASTGQVSLLASPDFETKSAYSITVNATTAGHAISKAVNIAVADLNEAPGNVALSASSVAENTSTATALAIGTLTSSDQDSGNTFTYSVAGGADAAAFVIAGNQLQFKAGTALDYETKGTYAVTVRTTDQGGLYYDKALTVSLTDVNEVQAFTSGATGTVNENAAAGTVVYTAAATDPENDAITYSLSGADAGAFAINASTGQVSLLASPDFETKSAYSVTVNATTAGHAISKAVNIAVADLNEAPGNVALSASSVAENTSTATALTIGTLTSSDQDSGNTFAYSIAGGADAAAFVIAGNQLQFKAGTVLDYESKGSYAVTVRTTDQGGLYYDKTFTINVTNVNEAPAFTSGATGTINENAAAGTVVYTAAATDPENDAITYSLSGADAGAFAINASTGQVSLLGSPDFEAKSAYSITVNATTAGHAISKSVNIAVADLNEAPGNLALSASSIAENTSTATALTIGTLTSSDQDSGNTFTYSIAGGADAAAFVIAGNQLQFKAGTALDHETKGTYAVTVRTTDQGGLHYDKTFTINVTNVNEAPAFTSGATGTVNENAAAGTVVYTAAATDPESDAITYSLGGADAGAFAINASTGQVSLLGSPDFEAKSAYSLTVSATAGGQTTNQAVNIAVADLNEAPNSLALSASSVAENTSTATALTIGTLASSDTDTGNTFTYTIAGGAEAAAFVIAGNQLQFKAGTALDYETKGTYAVTVRTTDQGGLYYDKAFTINVTNVNEAPAFTSGATGTVSENAAAGTVVYTAAATDPESDAITYSLNGADAGAFAINASTGQVSLLGSPDFEAKSAYSVTVSATAGGQTTNQAVNIAVADLNEAPSNVALSASSVAENTSTATSLAIGTLSSSDPDAGNTFTYTIAGGADAAAFVIAGNQLQFKAGTALDYETNGTYAVTVRTTDQGGLYHDKAFTINVTNVNEAPAFTSGATSTVNENAAAGTVVYTAAASDPENDAITYSLSGVDAGAFAINAGTGQVSLLGSPDFEAKSAYSVTVSATTAGHAISKAVNIAVADLNEAPSNLALSASSVAENASTATALAIGTLTSSDQDSGNTFTYSIAGGADASAFVIAGNQLQFKAGTALDYETKGTYAVTVRTTDQGGLYYDKALTVNVANVNEAPLLAAAVSYNVKPDNATAITGISVADPDAGANPITVSLSAPAGIFTGDSGAGVTALGSGTGTLSLTGSQGDINAFIAASKVSYTPAAGATGSVTLSINANDGGNAGSGGAQAATRTGALNIIPAAPAITAIATDSATAGDGLTNDNTLTLSGTAQANCTVEIQLAGVGPIGSVKADGAGRWTFDYTATVLVDGSYTFTATATDVIGNTSAVSAGFAVTIDTTAPAAPGVLALVAATDSGISTTDRITNVANPTITGTAAANATITLYDTDGATAVGTTSADGSGNWSITSGVLAQGTHTLNARATDAAGNTGASSAGLGVVIDTGAAQVVSGTVDGATLTLNFTEKVYATAAGMSVTVDGAALAIKAVGGSGTTTLTLTLASAVESGQAVSFSYHPNALDSNLVDAAGNELALLAPKAMTNVTEAVVTGPVVTTSMIDGVQLQTALFTKPDGSTSRTLTVPVVATERVDSVGSSAFADIPLASAGGSSLLAAQLPAGFGLTASGSDTPRSIGTSLSDLIREIQAHTPAGSSDQVVLSMGAAGFLEGLASGSQVLVQTVVPSVASNATSTSPLTFSGASASPGMPAKGLVIDARGLPSGTTLQLQNVDFAAIVGSVRVTGGDGAQRVWGDGASQYIVLGAGDDVLHGGGGNDTIGSAGGNDQLFGDEGDDLLFGGEGNDLVDGGSGRDVVRLAGSSRAEYQLRVDHGKLVATQRNGGVDGTDTLANIETLRFGGAGGNGADLSFNNTDVASLVRLYLTLFGRAPDQAGLNHWIGVSEAGLTLSQIADVFAGSAEFTQRSGAMSNTQFVARLYEHGLGRAGSSDEVAVWTRLLDAGTVTRGDVALGFADSVEKIGLVGVLTTSLEVTW